MSTKNSLPAQKDAEVDDFSDTDSACMSDGPGPFVASYCNSKFLMGTILVTLIKLLGCVGVAGSLHCCNVNQRVQEVSAVHRFSPSGEVADDSQPSTAAALSGSSETSSEPAPVTLEATPELRPESVTSAASEIESRPGTGTDSDVPVADTVDTPRLGAQVELDTTISQCDESDENCNPPALCASQKVCNFLFQHWGKVMGGGAILASIVGLNAFFGRTVVPPQPQETVIDKCDREITLITLDSRPGAPARLDPTKVAEYSVFEERMRNKKADAGPGGLVERCVREAESAINGMRGSTAELNTIKSIQEKRREWEILKKDEFKTQIEQFQEQRKLAIEEKEVMIDEALKEVIKSALRAEPAAESKEKKLTEEEIDLKYAEFRDRLAMRETIAKLAEYGHTMQLPAEGYTVAPFEEGPFEKAQLQFSSDPWASSNSNLPGAGKLNSKESEDAIKRDNRAGLQGLNEELKTLKQEVEANLGGINTWKKIVENEVLQELLFQKLEKYCLETILHGYASPHERLRGSRDNDNIRNLNSQICWTMKKDYFVPTSGR